MAKGNQIVLVRLTPAILEQIAEAIAGRNKRTREEPWDRSGFIRVAIREKLHKMQRSRGRSRKRKPQLGGASTSEGKTNGSDE